MSELSRRRPASVAEAHEIDYLKALNYLGLSPGQPAAQALMLVCQRYELDPLLGHISLYDGKPYVHFAGYLHIANDHPQFEGIECMREWETDTHFHATVRVHRSDRSYPSERTGRSAKLKRKKDGSKYEDEHADAKAFAQAARRALRMAFNVDHPEPSEDHGEQPAPAPVVEVARMVDGQAVEQTSEPGADTGADSVSATIRPGSGHQSGTGRQASAPARDDPGMVPGPTSAAAPPGGDEPAAAARSATTSEDGEAIPQAPDDEAGPAVDLGPGTDAVPGARSTGPAPPIEQASPLIAWCLANHVNPGTARLYLARQHPTDFGRGGTGPVLVTINDMAALRGEDAERAIAYLAAQFIDTDEQEGG